MKAALIAVVLPFMGTLAYIPNGKEGLLSGMLLRGWLNSIKNKGADVSYLDLSDGLPLDTRAMNRDLEEEQLFSLDYDGLGDTNMYPSIRDQEYLQHSTLWGNQYISGGAGDGNQILGPGLKISQQEIKTDASLPAYCNPPNPCPVEYTEDQGCLENFENTAAFSRNYQGLQDCMCDTEHMFDCPSATNPMIEDPIEVARVDLSRLFHQSLKRVKSNPFLTGEKLPVAAKKGNNMY
ncbi:neuroendocrine protein 7B2 [Euwallacea fornicatus]|uniref:neuroendocrine protein 7B2 n=1 Tax=Euwallacea fornicatus TaxID=995702 RepID=UPI00338F6F33